MLITVLVSNLLVKQPVVLWKQCEVQIKTKLDCIVGPFTRSDFCKKKKSTKERTQFNLQCAKKDNCECNASDHFGARTDYFRISVRLQPSPHFGV